MVTATDCEEVNADVLKFLGDTGWKPTRTKLVAGALRYSQYNFFKQQIMKIMAKRGELPTDSHEDNEFTDWDDLEDFLTAFVNTEAGAGVT